MEIDIPDLDDVQFERVCNVCRGRKNYQTWAAVPRERNKAGKLKPERFFATDKVCEFCDKDGMEPTIVGQRLLDFLAKHAQTK